MTDAENAKEHARLDARIDQIHNRSWWLFGLLFPILLAGVLLAAAVYGDTQNLKKDNEKHVLREEMNEFKIERTRIDAQQTKALNWQTQAIEAIANKVGAADQLPSRPPMIDDREH